MEMAGLALAFPTAQNVAVPVFILCKTIHQHLLSTLSAKEKDSGERIKSAALCGGREKSPVDFPSGLPTLLRIITIAQYFFLCNKPLGKPSSKPLSKPRDFQFSAVISVHTVCISHFSSFSVILSFSSRQVDVSHFHDFQFSCLQGTFLNFPHFQFSLPYFTT